MIKSLLIIILTISSLGSSAQSLILEGDYFRLVDFQKSENKVIKNYLSEMKFIAFMGGNFNYPTQASWTNDEQGTIYPVVKHRGKHIILQDSLGKWGTLTADGEMYFEFKYNYPPKFINNDYYALATSVYNNESYEETVGWTIYNNKDEGQQVYLSLKEQYKNTILAKNTYGKYGLFDATNLEIIFPFDHISPSWDTKNFGFTESGLLELKNSSGKCGLINYKGDTILPFEYEYVEHPFEEQNLVKKNGLWGTIDIEGNIVTPCIYQELEYEFYQHVKSVVKLNDEWLIVDHMLKPTSDMRFEQIHEINMANHSFDFSIVKEVGGKYGMMNLKTEEYLVKPDYDTIFLEDKEFICQNKSKIDWYNLEGELILSHNKKIIQVKDDDGNDMFDKDKNRLYIQNHKGIKGLIHKESLIKGEQVAFMPPSFDQIIFEENLIFVVKNGLCGWISITKELIVTPEYEQSWTVGYIHGWEEYDHIIAIRNNMVYLFSFEGKLLDQKEVPMYGKPEDVFIK
jgi:hypothetical protein